MLDILKTLQSGQSAMLEQLGSIRSTLDEHEKTFNDLSSRLTKIESDLLSLSNVQSQFEIIESVATNSAAQVTRLSDRISHMESTSRRRNLIFYGFSDVRNEAWRVSEELVTDLCHKSLGMTIRSRDIERAHRLGAYREGKWRPIIVKFAHFKDKEALLSSSSKLKGTDYGISEDFAPEIRVARRRLIEFGKAQHSPFKLRYDKLICGRKTYVFDQAKQLVVEPQA